MLRFALPAAQSVPASDMHITLSTTDARAFLPHGNREMTRLASVVVPSDYQLPCALAMAWVRAPMAAASVSLEGLEASVLDRLSMA